MSLNTNVQSLQKAAPFRSRTGKRVYDSVSELIADPENPTPMIRVSKRYNPSPGFELYVKLERNNPFGSIKDRTALFMLNGLQLGPGQALVDSYFLANAKLSFPWHLLGLDLERFPRLDRCRAARDCAARHPSHDRRRGRRPVAGVAERQRPGGLCQSGAVRAAN